MTARAGAVRTASPPPSGDGWEVVNGALRQRLDELAAVTALLPVLPLADVRAHVAEVRSFLYDTVLRHAQAEELLLFPVFAELGNGVALTGALVAEHDTVRAAAGALDEVAARPMTVDNVEALFGVLEGIGLLLDGHLAHESEASTQLGQPSRVSR